MHSWRAAIAALYATTALALDEAIIPQRPVGLDSPHSPATAFASGDDRLLSLHRSLIEVESVTGNEHQLGALLGEYLESRHNLTVELQQVDSERFNVLAYPKTVQEGNSRVLVTSHIDTVPPFIPYSTGDDNTTIWGRGSVDAKAAVAAQIIAAVNLLESSHVSLPDDALSLLFVVGEETGGDGMRRFSSFHRDRAHEYDAVIFGEPTEGKLACGHKGNLGFTLHVTGKAAHSGYPWLGVSANALLIEALARLIAMEERLPASKKYGRSTLNVGRVDGGVAANVVAEKAKAQIAIRLAAGKPEDAREMIEEALKETRARAEKDGGKLELVFESQGYGPVDLECDVDGFETITVNYGTDVPNLGGAHQRYLYGPGSILVAHGPNEHLTVDELKEAVGAYEKLILHALGIS